MNRVLLTKIHLVLAAFMFPAILMFLVTGALYTWGSKGAWDEKTIAVKLSTPMVDSDRAALMKIAAAELNARDVALPSGGARVSSDGDRIVLSWTGARSDIKLSSTADPLVADMEIAEASLHRWLVQLHKAKGTAVFKVYASFLAFSLFLLVGSGLIMGLQVPAMRKLTLGSGAVGLATFVGFVLAG